MPFLTNGRKVLPTPDEEEGQNAAAAGAPVIMEHTTTSSKWTRQCSNICILIAVIQFLVIVVTYIYILSKNNDVEDFAN